MGRQSPFPGMDPYLEKRWSSMHVLMMSAISSQLKASLPDDLEARPEEDVRIETLAGERLAGFRPDIAVVDSGVRSPQSTRSTSSAVLVEPVRLAMHRGPVVLRSIHVVDARDHDRVVTVIEVLSPWNKLPGSLNREYLAKLRTLEEAGANWIEIDLLRGGRSHLSVTWEDLPSDRRSNYLALTYNSSEADLLAYPMSIRAPLPQIAIPLREKDPTVRLDLQAALDRVLDDGPFDSIDRTTPLSPPLSAEDAAWLSAQLPASS